MAKAHKCIIRHSAQEPPCATLHKQHIILPCLRANVHNALGIRYMNVLDTLKWYVSACHTHPATAAVRCFYHLCVCAIRCTNTACVTDVNRHTVYMLQFS